MERASDLSITFRYLNGTTVERYSRCPKMKDEWQTVLPQNERYARHMKGTIPAALDLNTMLVLCWALISNS